MGEGHCGCRNHKGKPKVMHPSREAALDAILTRYLRQHAASTVVPCKRREGIWHVQSRRGK